MKNIKTIFLKEMKRFFTEPRMLAALFLPGIIICLIYSLLGGFMESNFSINSGEPSNYTYNIAYTDNFQSEAQNDIEPLIIQSFESYVSLEETTNTVNVTSLKVSEVENIKEEVIEDENAQIVRSKSIFLDPITLDEAIKHMEALGHSFYIYLDSDDERVCVVYKRELGGYGLIEVENTLDKSLK